MEIKSSNNIILSLKSKALQLAVDELREELLRERNYAALQKLEEEYKKRRIEEDEEAGSRKISQ